MQAQRQSEKLGRAVVAVRGVDMGGNGTNNWSGSGANQVYVGWRLLATDPEGIGFNVYRSANGGAATKLTSSPITTSTNYVDTAATLTVPNSYYVTPVVNGVEGAASEAWTLPANTSAEPCFTIPMPAIAAGAYYVHLAWAGDLDGDGYPDIVVDRLPSTDGTLPIMVDAYSTKTRTRLWQINLGPKSHNSAGDGLISSGQNDGVTVFDFDGDGKCEVITKTTVGTVFADGTTIPGSGTTVYLSVVEGATGKELSRLQIATGIGSASDSHDAKNIGVAFCDGVRPNLIVMDEDHNFAAYNFNATTKALSQRWSLTSPTSPYPHSHSFRVADVDGDGKDEVCDIGMAVDDNGTLLFQNELNHGDRFHVADIDPARPGLECFSVQQDNPTQLSYELADALTGQMLWRKYSPSQVDNGRGNIGSIDSRYTSMQLWSAASSTIVDKDGVAASNTQPVCNFSIWWDADNLREVLNRQLVDKWNSSGSAGGTSRQLTGYNFHSATYSWRDAVPLYGDILGDWREEIVMEDSADSMLVIFTTTKVASSRYSTLLQDPQYRTDLTIKGYMQTHNPSFYFGNNMPRAPRAPYWNGDLTWVGNAANNAWNAGPTANFKSSATGVATAFANAQSVLFDLTGVSSTAVAVTGTLSPSAVVVHAPKGQSYTFGGTGSLAGAMTLTKGGQGSLTLAGTNSFTGATVVSEGTLLVNGALSGSAVRVDSRGGLGGTGIISQAVALSEIRSVLTPGGAGTAGTLTLGGGLSEAGGAVNQFDLSNNAASGNDQVNVTGNLTFTGANIIKINFLNGAPAAGGVYTLFTYTGTFTGTLSAQVIQGSEAYPCTIANTGSAITLTFGTQRAAASVTWAGGSGNAWNLASSANWLRAGSADVFVTGDSVLFNDAGAANGTVSLPNAVYPASTSVNSASNYSLSGAGAIAGTGGLAKAGTGTLTVTTANTFTGPTTISGGTLAVTALADGGFASPLGASDNSSSNLTINGGALSLGGASSSTFRGMTLGASGGTLDVTGSNVILNLGGVITGSGSLMKTGTGTLVINAVNTYTGGTVIKAGKILLVGSREDYSATSPIQYGLGTGSVTLDGGTLTLADTSVGDFDGVDSRAYWNIIVPSGSSGRLDANGRMNLASGLSGAGTFTFFTPFVRTDISGNWSPFTGLINVVTDGDGGDFRLANSAGMPSAEIHLAASVYMYSRAGTGTTTFNIGALSGDAGSVVNAGTGSGAGQNQPAIWRVGGRNTDATFAGVISGTSAIIKAGTAIWTLSGANTYTGATTVQAGTLRINGSLSGTAVTVQTGATLDGAGAIIGNVTINSGGTLAAGSAGALTITGNVTNNGTVRFTGGAAAGITGTFTNNGVFDIITGLQTLPANFVNNGTVLDSSAVKTGSVAISGGDIVITIKSYAGHDYQLQTRGSLTSGSWQNVGAAQPGNGATLTFTSAGGATNAPGFYRVVVAP